MRVFRKEVWVSNVIWQLSQTTPSVPSPKCKKISIWPEPLQYAQGPAAAKSLQSCPTLCDPIDGSSPGPRRPWDSPGKNTGVGCHFLLQACTWAITTGIQSAKRKWRGNTAHKGTLRSRGLVPWNAHSLKTCAVLGRRAQRQDTEPLLPKSLPIQTRNEPGSAFTRCVSSKNPVQEWEKSLPEVGGHWPYCWSTYHSAEEIGTLPLGREQKTRARVHACVRVCVLRRFNRVWLFLTLWTVADQSPPFMGFSRQEYWSGSPCLSPGGLPNPGIEPESPAVPAMQVDSLPPSHLGSPQLKGMLQKCSSLSFHVPGVFQDVTGMVCTLL